MLGNKAIVFCVGKQACVGSISGEVPGLYTPEELEPLLSPLKDAASQDGFTGPLYNYFSYSQSYIPPCRSLFLSVFVSAVCLSFVCSQQKKKFLCTDYCVHLPAVYCIMCCKTTAVSVRLRLLPENQINSFIIVKVNPLKCSMFTISIQIFQGVTGLKISVTQNLAAALTSPPVFFLLALCYRLFVLTPMC